VILGRLNDRSAKMAGITCAMTVELRLLVHSRRLLTPSDRVFSFEVVKVVSAAGNFSTSAPVYPAALNTNVMGVAYTADQDTLSSFSNYGNTDVWIGAPGEYMMGTYPGGTYTCESGTSFSSPLVAGSADLLNRANAASALPHAVQLPPNLNHGRLDVYQAISAWLNSSSGQ
jgi:subtilisin family serine protease